MVSREWSAAGRTCLMCTALFLPALHFGHVCISAEGLDLREKDNAGATYLRTAFKLLSIVHAKLPCFLFPFSPTPPSKQLDGQSVFFTGRREDVSFAFSSE